MKVIHLSALAVAITLSAHAVDWPQHGRDVGRNMVSPDTGLPSSFEPGGENTPAKNIKWTRAFSEEVRGLPIVADGKVYLAAAAAKDDPKYPESDRADRKKGALHCFDEETGAPLWKFVSNKRGHTIGRFGLMTAPVIEGDRAYLLGGFHYVFCLTTEGLGDRNVGPVTNERALYEIEKPYALEANDADMVWMFDTKKRFPKIQFHNAYAYTPLVFGDYVYVSTGNGAVKDLEYMDTNHPPRPNADVPTLMMLDKKTGKLVAHDTEGMGRGMIHGSWGTACVGTINGENQILYGGCDGVVYGFEPEPERGAGEVGKMKKIWSFDPNFHLGAERRFEIFGPPVCVDNHVFAALSDDWTHPKVPGILVCFEATGAGDLTQTAEMWAYRDIGVSEGAVSVADGLVYAADLNGRVHCLDQKTGEPYWVLKTKGAIRANTVVADGKVFFGNSNGEFYILKADKTLKVLHQTKFPGGISGACVVANGGLYIVAGDTLYAIKTAKKKRGVMNQ